MMSEDFIRLGGQFSVDKHYIDRVVHKVAFDKY
jgi:hypothetical protein